MDWKKLALSAVVGGALAIGGCSGGDGGGSTGGGSATGGGGGTDDVDAQVDEGPPEGCADPSMAGEEAAIDYLVTTVTIPEDNTVGFDLDDAWTRSPRDTVGCGKIDGVGGIDNQLVALLSALSELLEGTDINTLIQEALADGTIEIVLEVSGYNGTGDDECVAINVIANGEQANGAAIGGVVVGGTLSGSIPTLPLTIPFPGEEGADPIPVEIDVTQTLVSVPLEGGTGTIAGAVAYQGNLRDALEPVIGEISDSIDLATIDGIINPQLDYDTTGANAGTCDAVSLGLTFGVTAQTE